MSKRLVNKSGALLIDKPVDFTSHDVVAKLRNILKERRIGHTGTLDPFATGLLILCLGRATRLAQYLSGEKKSYEALIRFGFATDTQDYSGKPITPISSSEQLTVGHFLTVLRESIGEQWQIPPMYSAKKVGGETLHKLARRGEIVTRAPVKVTVFSAELSSPDLIRKEDGTCEIALRIECSAGTYIRTFAHDLGAKLALGGHLAALRRTKIGEFSVDMANTIETISQSVLEDSINKKLITASQLLKHFHSVKLSSGEVDRVRRGNAVVDKAQLWESGTKVRLLDDDDEMIALAEVVINRHGNFFQPRILLVGEE